MKYLRQWAIILLMCLTGELTTRLFHLPVPGNVIGMVLLFVLLFTKTIKLEMVETVSDSLLNHLALFFLPAGVGLMTCFTLIKDKLIPFILLLVITTIIVMAATGHTIQQIKRRRRTN